MDVFRGSNGDAIVVDDGYFPVVVSTWFGKASESAARAYYAWLGDVLRRALRERQVLVNVVDAAKAEVPTADVRRLISDLTREWEKSGATPATVRALVVIESAPIRGVLNVLNWLHGDMHTENVASLDAAARSAGLTKGTLVRPPRP